MAGIELQPGRQRITRGKGGGQGQCIAIDIAEGARRNREVDGLVFEILAIDQGKSRDRGVVDRGDRQHEGVGDACVAITRLDLDFDGPVIIDRWGAGEPGTIE
ncbi:MAG TPA: hypothetical protein VF491_18295 [Vicinamibacterales bacterium]